MIRSVLALVLLASVVAGGCRRAASSNIPDGVYSGSTADDRAITVEVRGDEVLVDRRPAELVKPDRNSAFKATRLPGDPTFTCSVVARGEELRCDVRSPDGEQILELMRE